MKTTTSSYFLNVSTSTSPSAELSDELTPWELWGYSLALPLICVVGVTANTMSLVVLIGGNLKESLYTYLTMLSAADLVTVTLVMFSGPARGFFNHSFSWQCFDVFVHIPIASVSTTVSILTLVMVTGERLAMIRAPVLTRKFCSFHVARRLCGGILIFSLIFNIPYCLIFTLKEGRLIYHNFVKSKYYSVHNWLRLVLLGLLPGVFLLIGNIFLLISLKQSNRRRLRLVAPILTLTQNLHSSIPSSLMVYPRTHRLLQDHQQQRRVTLVLVLMITSFLLGEAPTHIASRASATSLLFPSQPQMFYTTGFRIFKLVATLLMAIHYSSNFFLYCALNKKFVREFHRLRLRVKNAVTNEVICCPRDESNKVVICSYPSLSFSSIRGCCKPSSVHPETKSKPVLHNVSTSSGYSSAFRKCTKKNFTR